MGSRNVYSIQRYKKYRLSLKEIGRYYYLELIWMLMALSIVKTISEIKKLINCSKMVEHCNRNASKQFDIMMIFVDIFVVNQKKKLLNMVLLSPKGVLNFRWVSVHKF